RGGRILGEGKDAAVEGELRQFAIDRRRTWRLHRIGPPAERRGHGGKPGSLRPRRDSHITTVQSLSSRRGDARLSANLRSALASLARFRERLSGLHPSALRVVATNTFRVAKNAREFLAVAERALGLPIDVISGHEEARLTFFGVAHELPPSSQPRLVIDIGG